MVDLTIVNGVYKQTYNWLYKPNLGLLGGYFLSNVIPILVYAIPKPRLERFYYSVCLITSL